MAFPLNSEVIPGIEYEHDPSTVAKVFQLGMGKMPTGFPYPQWSEQMSRYEEYWSWWKGDVYNEIVGTTDDGEPIYKFPLKINNVRTFARIHNSMLFGEVPDDPNAHSPVYSRFKPKADLVTGKVADDNKQTAKTLERIVNEVWAQSNPRSLMYQAGIVSQFLGGAFFQFKYEPWKTDLRIPITVHYLKPDFVLPVWDTNEWDLLECWIVYRISPATAESKYGFKVDSSKTAGSGTTFVNYVEHWTRDKYSIWIDGKPLVARYNVPDAGQMTINYNNRPNPFGVVPIVYIPRMREGNFYGSSLVADITGLSQEYNGRMADLGDLIQQNNDREWFGRNINQTPRPKQFDNGKYFTDLGSSNPGTGRDPEVWATDPPRFSPEMPRFNNDIHTQMMREGNVSPISLGEDEGAQRSGITLQIRMWPTISIARVQRQNWTTGKNHGDKIILKMLLGIGWSYNGFSIPSDFLSYIELGQKWAEFLPRDEEQLVNRLAILKQSHQMSLRRSLVLQGDVDDIEEEIEFIEEDLERMQKYETTLDEANVNLDEPSANAEVDDSED